MCQYFFPRQFNLFMFLQNQQPSVIGPCGHTDGPTCQPSCATSKGIQLLETVSLKLYRVNPISLQRAWRKRFQFLCSWALWWPRSSLHLRTRGMSDLGTVPGLLFGLLPSNLWSHCLCAELWLNTGHFSPPTPAQSQPRECLCHRGGSCRETRTFSWGWKGFSVLIPARVPP